MGWSVLGRRGVSLASVSLLAVSTIMASDVNAQLSTSNVRSISMIDNERMGNAIPLPLVANTYTVGVYPGTKTRLRSSVFVNVATCTLVSSGTWTVTQAPKYGSYSVGIENTTVPSGQSCAGHTYPWSTLYYTRNNTSPPTLGDVLAANFTGYQGQSTSWIFNANPIQLQINFVSAPANNQYLITDSPAMPTIKAQARVVNANPDPTPTTIFSWSPSISVTDGKKQPHDYSKFLVQNAKTTGSTVFTMATTPAATFVGGSLGMKVTATIDGHLLTATSSVVPTVVGTNPKRLAIQNYISKNVPSLSLNGLQAGDVADLSKRMVCQESMQRQFNAAANGGIGPVLFAPDNGVGISQLTNPSPLNNPNLLFDWQSNVYSGLTLFTQKIPSAKGYAARLKLLPDYAKAIADVNMKRILNRLAPITINPAPTYTAAGPIGSNPVNQLLEDSTRGYNGYAGSLYGAELHEFKPDIDYLETAPNSALPTLSTNPRVWMRVPSSSRPSTTGDPNYVSSVTLRQPECGG